MQSKEIESEGTVHMESESTVCGVGVGILFRLHLASLVCRRTDFVNQG